MPPITFRRISNHPPPERELLTIDDDGGFSMWRSTGFVGGRFAGTVPDAGRVLRLVESAARVPGPETAALPPGASLEEVEVDGRAARFEARRDVVGPWGELLSELRVLLEALCAQPLAAVAAVVVAADRIRLEHRGSASLPVELDAARVTVDVWRDGRQVATSGTGPLGLGRIDAGPGWAVDVEVSDLDTVGGGILVARVSLVADDGGIYVPVTLTASMEL